VACGRSAITSLILQGFGGTEIMKEIIGRGLGL
jgi:hypothetical protein